jgi:hypothetical protein
MSPKIARDDRIRATEPRRPNLRVPRRRRLLAGRRSTCGHRRSDFPTAPPRNLRGEPAFCLPAPQAQKIKTLSVLLPTRPGKACQRHASTGQPAAKLGNSAMPMWDPRSEVQNAKLGRPRRDNHGRAPRCRFPAVSAAPRPRPGPRRLNLLHYCSVGSPNRDRVARFHSGSASRVRSSSCPPAGLCPGPLPIDARDLSYCGVLFSVRGRYTGG